MAKHYAKRHLTRTADIFDQINIPNDDTTAKDSTSPDTQGERGEASTDSSTT
jgi:hypothetical protein